MAKAKKIKRKPKKPRVKIRRPGRVKQAYHRRSNSKKINRKKKNKIFKNGGGRETYTLNTGFEFFYELRDLILKSSPAEKDKMIERISRLGRVRLAIISGIFINKENLDPLVADLLIVGEDIERSKMKTFLKALEAEVGKEIKFAVMDKEEFNYRLAMFDRFVRVLLESPHEKLINKLGL